MPETIHFEDYEKVFVGQVHAIGLSRRGIDDPHVLLTLISGDDGHWFISECGSFSSYWIPELKRLLEEAENWMKTYLLPDIADDRQHGYKFKD